MSKQSSVLANVGVLLGAMVLGISVGMADPTKSGSSRPMGEKMAMQEKMATEKETDDCFDICNICVINT